MMFLAALSKLPQDLLDVRHILPEWLKYVDVLLWWLGGFVVLSLAADLAVKGWRYLKESALERGSPARAPRRMSKADFKSALSAVLNDVNADRDFRSGLHRVSALVKTYLEIQLQKDIEEMTANEIAAAVKERRDLGPYFIALTFAQYKSAPPRDADFAELYNKTVDLANRI